MKFNSAEEIYDEISGGTDLYFKDSGIYVFLYAERGSIAYYYLSEDQLRKLAEEVGPEDYVGGALGPGGYIIDPDIVLSDGTIIEYDTPEYDEYDGYSNNGWEYDYTPIYDFLERFVGEEAISAMPADLIDFGSEG